MVRPFGCKRRSVCIIVLLGLLLASIGILKPLLTTTYDPNWVDDSATFLKMVGEGLVWYADDHNGDLPSTLSLLYPKYVKDNRVLKGVAEFGSLRVPMAIIYYKPKRMGDSRTAVAEVRLYPNVKTKYHWRGLVLWGDNDVHLEK